jgi:hypothetical protein
MSKQYSSDGHVALLVHNISWTEAGFKSNAEFPPVALLGGNLFTLVPCNAFEVVVTAPETSHGTVIDMRARVGKTSFCRLKDRFLGERG